MIQGTPAPPHDEPQRPGRARRVALAAVAAVAVLGATVGAGLAGTAGQTIAGSAQPVVEKPVAAIGSSMTATAAHQVGVVDINTDLKYANSQAAGTGMILTSSGQVLTNNHVIEGATTINVTVLSTGQTYAATVVGSDATNDVAVLQMTGASDLATVQTGDSAAVAVGDPVLAVGNAGGDPDTTHTASGTVVALNQTITASDQGGQPEQLSGMIQVTAAVQSGDSGGPLHDVAGEVIGMNTAAGTSGRRTRTTAAFAIPINKALAIASQIENGQASSTVHIGASAFLGVQVTADAATSGAVVAGIVPSGPAVQAGIVIGDVITSVDDRTVSSTSLSTIMEAYRPGDRVRVTWSDSSGRAHSATVTLAEGPAS
ncbi:MAG: trypsin-like peptidase domain-containing protein [Pseudonocardiales bacterium]|nr:trypsin-like peptidase domain-containing protein [Pseudonocardiales bacterium]